MKQFIIFLALLFSIKIHAQHKLKVVSSASIFMDMTKHITDTLAELYTIVPIGADPHLYEPTPADAQLIKEADLILINGLTFEGWINELIENSGTKAKTILITEGIVPIASEEHAGATDPHSWMDALNGLVYIDNIKNALVEIDPKHATTYIENYKIYREQMIDLDQFIRSEINKIPIQYRILITSHDAFAYYGRRYGIKLNAIIGISTESDAQTADIIRVSKSIKESGVPAIFIESTINPKMLKQIAQDNNVKIGGELFADSIGDSLSAAPSYIDMLKHNTITIVNALTETRFANTKLDQKSIVSSAVMYGFLVLTLFLSLVYMILKVDQNHG